MDWRRFFMQATRHQLQVGKLKTLLDTRGNRLCCSQVRFQSSCIRSRYIGPIGRRPPISAAEFTKQREDYEARIRESAKQDEAVITEFESQPSLNPSALSEYVKALVNRDRVVVKSQFLLNTLQRGFAMNEEVQHVESNTTFKDVKGAYYPKEELKEIVEYLRDPEYFARLGAMLPKCYLLAGPDGTGKTMLARAVAGEARVPFFSCNGREFETYFGDGVRRMSDLFAAAKKQSPSIIFIDEIDQIYTWRTFDQLIVELDGLKQNDCIIVIAATDDPDSLHTSLVKIGRFDRRVDVLKPNEKEKLEILASLMSKVPMDFGRGFVDISHALSGADLANMVNNAALEAARNGAKAVTPLNMRFAMSDITMAKGYCIPREAKGCPYPIGGKGEYSIECDEESKEKSNYYYYGSIKEKDEDVIREFERQPTLHPSALSRYVKALVQLQPYTVVQSQFLLNTLQRGLGMNEEVQPTSVESNTTFSDYVKGANSPKVELKEIIDYLRDPECFARLGAELPKGYLLAGPIGTSKIMLAHAIAREAGVPFFPCNGREFERHLGDGAHRMRDVFAAAKKQSRSIIFIDEIDKIHTKMIFNQLIVELDVLKQKCGIIVIAAAHVPDSLNEALFRHGRFDRRADFLKPDEYAQQQKLKSILYQR